MDVGKIGPGIYQYTAIDDCSDRRPADLKSYTLINVAQLPTRLIFQIGYRSNSFIPSSGYKRIVVGTGLPMQFFAYCFQEKLREYCIAAANRQISPGQTPFTAFEWKSREEPADRPTGVLPNGRLKRSCFKRPPGGMAVLL